MTQEMNLILTRRREVEAEIERTKALLSDLEREIGELDMAGRVIARLSGAKWPETGAADQRAATVVHVPTATVRKLTLPEMIEVVLTKAHRSGRKGLEPKEIRQHIAESLDPEVKSEAVSSICWRMWKRGQLQKVDDTAAYRLPASDNLNLPGLPGGAPLPSPEKEKPVDAQSSPDTSTGLFSNPEHGREAGQGGGT